MRLRPELLFCLLACTAETGGEGPAPWPVGEAGAVLPEGGSAQPDATLPGDAQSDAAGPSQPSAPVRFLVLGDGGTGEAGQKKVAEAAARVCAERGCSFALYLGDNIYNNGVSGASDMQFVQKFEEPYAALDIPFYVVLGNHDYGSEGSNLFPDDAKSAAQVEYTAHSDKWNMPAYFYTFREGPIAFFALDTNAIVIDRFRNAQAQKAWLDAEMAKSDAPWKMVFGHHPYISNGDHGNAGAYGIAFGLELHNGAPLKALVEESVCGKAQVFFAGHDHHREWLEPNCGTTFIISGAAAKLRGIPGKGNPARWADGQKLGFLWAEVDEDAMYGVFYDEDGVANYEDVIER